MSDKKRIEGIVEKVKEYSNHLNSFEKESLRDQLLAYLLFGNYNDQKGIDFHKKDVLRGLSDQEREIIRKLAEQTENLFRIHHEDDKDCD